MRTCWRRIELLLIAAALASLGFAAILLSRLRDPRALRPDWRWLRDADQPDDVGATDDTVCDADQAPARCLYFAADSSPLAASYDGLVARVCRRRDLDEDGCCDVPPRLDSPGELGLDNPSLEPCAGCDTSRGCCHSLVSCIACCLSPGNAAIRAALQRLLVRPDAANPAYALLADADAAAAEEDERRPERQNAARQRPRCEGSSAPAETALTAAAALRFCTLRCRTSAGATWHENRYRSERASHCYGAYRPPLDAKAVTASAAAAAAATEISAEAEPVA
jgi:hypothetical protein